MGNTTPANSCRRLGLAMMGAFFAGFASVLTFFEAGFWILNTLQVIKPPAALFSMTARPPLNVPAIISLAFWGGVWALWLLPIRSRLPRTLAFLIAALLFGAVAIPLFNWYILNPLRSGAVGPPGGWTASAAIGRSSFVNGMFGLGAGVFLLLLKNLTARRGADT